MTSSGWENAPTDLWDDTSDARTGVQPAAEETPPEAAPTVLTMDEKECVKLHWAWWRAQEQTAHLRNVYTEANRKRRAGERYVAVVKAPDAQQFRVYTPPSSAKTPPTLGKSARLCRRVVSTLFTDPPVPEGMPASDDTGDREAAEFATRWLINYGSESYTNVARTAFRAMSLACTYRSAFRHWYIDPEAGGAVPETVQASPAATTRDDATHRTVQQPVTDPMGQPVLDEMGQPILQTMKVPQLGPFVTRYVRPDGSLADQPAEAALVWRPAIRCDVVTSRNVRLVPESCDGIDDADVALLVMPMPVGLLRRMFPETIGAATKEALSAAVAWRPESHKYLLPTHLKEDQLRGTPKQDGEVADDAIAFVLTAYHKSFAALEDGAHVVIVGESLLAHRGAWAVRREDGQRVDVPIPIDQWRQFREGIEDPMGIGLMDLLGSGDELLQAQYGNWIEHLDRFANRKTFVPHTSTFQPGQASMPMGSYIPIPPGQEPRTEDVPEYPRGAIEFLKLLQDELNDESALQEAGQGLDSSNVQSGFHASLVMERVQSALSEPHQHARDALIRGWRIMLALGRAYFPDAQQLRVLGDDQTAKYQSWSAADLGTTTDVQLARASFTMMTPTQKAMVAQNLFQAQVIDGDELQRIMGGNVGGLLAIQDNPLLLEVRRQVTAWEQDPQTPNAFGLEPLEPHYDEPTVAQVRHRVLLRYLASVKSHQHGPEARQTVVLAYQQARQVLAMAAQPALPPGGDGASTGAPDGAPIDAPAADPLVA
jgi:hypothetical protein